MATELQMKPAAADRPPDPDTAAASVREARRRLLASQGIVKAILGAVFLAAFAAVRLVFERETAAYANTVIILTLAFIEAEVLLPLVAAHFRRRRGLPVGRAEAETQRILNRTRNLIFIGALGAGTIVLIAAAIIGLDIVGVSAEWLAGFDTAVALACTALLALLFLARYRDLRLWEDILMAAAVTAAGVLLAFARHTLRAETFAMIIAAPAIIAGLSLHLRWRRWTRFTQEEPADRAAGEVRP
jgi:NADH:ubiquinone oxidoreductase subunit K